MIKKGIASLLMLLAVAWSFDALMPSKTIQDQSDLSIFSTQRALSHVEAMSQKPHGVGMPEHAVVRQYLIDQLRAMGLETQIQQGFSLTGWGNLSKPKNILARIRGNSPGKALMLLSHYDSNPHSSYGASDAASGVATILEGVRAYLHKGSAPKNDIIILFTDSEELGLNGADLFVNSHEWSKDVGLVLNFEARGSGGPSYMLIETNGGNSKLIEKFIKADPKYPVANSLAYSIYKMLPNDTDLTIFREDGDIEGFNFAFIDDHFDYHTALDTYERLDPETLEHQGQYLMPLLAYFAQANLNDVKSDADTVYFNFPGAGLVNYPFSWIWPMLAVAFLCFLILIFIGFKTRRLIPADVLNGTFPFLLSVISCCLIGFGLYWLLFDLLYPGYKEMLHGFTYNGHGYIAAVSIFSLSLCFYIYARFYKPGNPASLMIMPIFLWLLIVMLAGLYLKGASFFIIPVFFALVSLAVMVKQRKPNLILMALLSFPLLMIFSPLVKMFPVGLGLDSLFISGIMIALCFGLLTPVFGYFKHKRRWSVLLLILGLGLFISANFSSSFDEERPKPNSLVYVLDADKNSAQWATYDKQLDEWTRQKLGEDPNESSELGETVFSSKYSSGFTYFREAERKPLIYPEVEIYKDTLIEGKRHLSIYIASKRRANRIDLYTNPRLVMDEMTINGLRIQEGHKMGFMLKNRTRSRLFTYYISDNDALDLKIVIPSDQKSEFIIYESSNNLLNSRHFDIQPRTAAMIPKPFVLNDAVIIKRTVSIE